MEAGSGTIPMKQEVSIYTCQLPPNWSADSIQLKSKYQQGYPRNLNISFEKYEQEQRADSNSDNFDE